LLAGLDNSVAIQMLDPLAVRAQLGLHDLAYSAIVSVKL